MHELSFFINLLCYFNGMKSIIKRLDQLLARKYGRNSTTRHQVVNWLNLA